MRNMASIGSTYMAKVATKRMASALAYFDAVAAHLHRTLPYQNTKRHAGTKQAELDVQRTKFQQYEKH